MLEYTDFEGALIKTLMDELVFWYEDDILFSDEDKILIYDLYDVNYISYVKNMSKFLLENKDTDIYEKDVDVIFDSLRQSLTIEGIDRDTLELERYVYMPKVYINDLIQFVKIYLREEKDEYIDELLKFNN